IGPDGHMAFNEPGSSLRSRTRVKSLAYDTIQANARFFNNDASQVPKEALTVGVGTIMDAKEVMILVTGSAKAFALHQAIECGINHMWTVSMLQEHAAAYIVCDADATLELKVKTVKYFKVLSKIANMHEELNNRNTNEISGQAHFLKMHAQEKLLSKPSASGNKMLEQCFSDSGIPKTAIQFVELDVLEEKKHISVESLTESRIINSIVIVLDQTNPKTEVQLFVDCILEGKIHLDLNLLHLFKKDPKFIVVIRVPFLTFSNKIIHIFFKASLMWRHI
ncbi:unnamed protein product, partial [Nesidiocoris tenuis]